MTMYAMMMMTLVKIMMIDEADDDDDYLPPGRATSARRVSSGSVSGEEAGEIGDLIITSLMITVMITMMTLTNITMTNMIMIVVTTRAMTMDDIMLIRFNVFLMMAKFFQRVKTIMQVFPKSKNKNDLLVI